ncbi:hypothetical protein [Pseudomonas sp. MRSN 12121]|uniref:hypothetical protein n=1 Tax=Pseudomonas sp. MRSN 12121 TaxID=1611770 RepID=UPI000B2DE05D|nr:hypothetical protein [Pseudomonas sp. MRSN 12121]
MSSNPIASAIFVTLKPRLFGAFSFLAFKNRAINPRALQNLGVLGERRIGWRDYHVKASIFVLAALYCLSTRSALADASQPPNDPRAPAGIAVGEPLVAARAKLVGHGWLPTPMHARDGYEYSGVERELAAHRFFEVDTCSFDSSRCILFYSRKGTCLRVDTLGERLNEMTVTRWTEECPEAPAEPGKDGAG